MGYRIVRITNEMLESLLTEGVTYPNHLGERLVCERGLPVGAKLEGVSADIYFDRGLTALRFSHPSWADVPEGTPIPELDIRYRTACVGGDPPCPAVG